MADPVPLFLHEVIDIVGRGGRAYMEHTVGFDAGGTTDGGLELVGTWEVVGTTGRWPQVVNLWEIDGWDGWARLGQRTNVDKAANAELADVVGRGLPAPHRRVRPAPPRRARAAPARPSCSRPAPAGAGSCTSCPRCAPAPDPEYLAATRAERAPAMADRGIALVGLYDSVLTDTEVCTIWATDLAAHTALLRDGDPWPATARQWCTRWREELMTPGAGSPLARSAAPA